MEWDLVSEHFLEEVSEPDMQGEEEKGWQRRERAAQFKQEWLG